MTDKAEPDRKGPTSATLHQLLETMELIRRVDEKSSEEVRAGRLRAAVYPVRGLEAVCAAIGAVARPGDPLVSTYRNLGDVVAKGVDLRSVIAELYGRETGTSKGKGGPMHLADPSVGLMATSGIVGGGLPIAVGLALAKKLDGQGAVCFTTFGDGAVSIGAFHESLNLASLWQLPIVFICQNNQWGEHTAYRDYAPVESVQARGSAYGITCAQVDGFDPVACWAAMDDATTRARSGDGPSLLEFVTYRLAPHSAAGDASYVPTDELEEAMRRDPVPNFRQWLLDQEVLGPEQLASIETRARELVDDAFEFAMSSPSPTLDERFTDIYSSATTGVPA
jgi:acetoin:2,6-dichlorophenolindophenol oxidoreductase subunit alpha